jgi:predicted N-acetyltransferase YhbS
MEITLREATVGDAAAMAALIREAFEEYRSRLDPPSGAHRESATSMELLLGRETGLLAFAGDELVGCVLYVPRGDGGRDAEHVYLHRLAVLPAWRGRGIGRWLMAEVESRARPLGFDRVRLGVRLGLPEIRAWYERLGYTCVVSWERHAGYDAPTWMVLEKRI